MKTNTNNSSFFKKSRKLLSLLLFIVMTAQILIPATVLFASAEDGAKKLSTAVKGADGKKYTVTATYGADAAIPDDATLSVKAIKPTDAPFEDYVTQAEETLYCSIDPATDIQLFDISIVSANDATVEYQPAEGAVVDMKILLATAPETEFGVVHFGEEKTERIGSEVDGRNITFEATGFSVYALVHISEEYKDNRIYNVDDFDKQPLYISATTKTQGNTYYLSYGTVQGKASGEGIVFKRTPQNTTTGATAYYFEKKEGTDNQFYMYVPTEDGSREYVDLTDPIKACYSPSPATAFTITSCGADKPGKFYLAFKKGSTTYYLNLRKDESGSGFNGSTFSTEGSHLSAYTSLSNDYLGLDGKTYGIVWPGPNHTAFGLLAEEKTETTLASAAVSPRSNPLDPEETVVIRVGGDLGLFTFHLKSGNEYYITTTIGGATKYLSFKNDALTLVDAPDTYSVFNVKIGADEFADKVKITAVASGRSLCFNDSAKDRFLVANRDNSTTYFHLAELTELEDDDRVSYVANKVSVSDNSQVKNGAKLIVYTRVWDDVAKEYKLYAIDHDGSLVLLRDEGETVRWAGTQINTMLWEFTEYYYWFTRIPNYYYELQNTYSHKYIAPQYHTGQTLSDNKIGINLNGRRYGNHYSTILAWDDHRYDYAGLSVGDGAVTAVPMSKSQDFYFAVMQPTEGSLTPDGTLNNDDYGIHMKMVKYPRSMSSGGRNSYQTSVVGTKYINAYNYGNNYGTSSGNGGLKYASTGMVTTDLQSNGYPTATETGKSLYELFDGAGATEVNHLFLSKVYGESGYFQYNSTQNSAVLDENGNFTVYNELATIETDTPSQGHGQFMPYNQLDPEKISQYINIKDVFNDPLPLDDPRLGEQLLRINSNEANYHFGMEMEASFVQSKNGEDAWGHDIIFEFAGDDDMWLYVDGELVLDLGGIHSALVGKINFKTGLVQYPDSERVEGNSAAPYYTTLREIFERNFRQRNPGATDAEVEEYLDRFFKPGTTVFKDYTSHTMKMFYMERGAGASNLIMRFNLTTATDGQLLLSKSVSGTDKQDYASAKFPFQIHYLDKTIGEYRIVSRTQAEVEGKTVYEYTGANFVNYEGKNEPVEYADDFHGYQNVFFIKPGETAEIQFPSDDMEYYITECRIDTSIYDRVSANDVQLNGTANGDYFDFSTEPEIIGSRKILNYDNHVSPNALRTLSITKELYDVNNERLHYTDDNTGFRFRIYIGDNLDYYRFDSYYIKNPEGFYCYYDYNEQAFSSIGVKDFAQLTEEQKDICTFTTSPSGAVDKIPADFTVEIRDLLIDTKFKIVEQESDIPKGYDLIGYDRVDGSYIVEDGDTVNSGIIRDRQNPCIIIKNHRGWGLTVEKIWSDSSFMVSHDNIYFAVYHRSNNVDTLINGTVRRMLTETHKTTLGDEELYTEAETSLYYYFPELLPGAKFSDYVIKEVIPNGNFTVDDNGYVTGYSSVTPLEEGDILTNGGIPAQTEVHTTGGFDYTVSYATGAPSGPANNLRTDTTTNTRPGIRIMKVDGNGDPLAGAVFTLKYPQTVTVYDEETGEATGTEMVMTDLAKSSYVSDATGLITYAYPENGVTYTLTETKTPSGYASLVDSITFTMNNGALTVTGTDDGHVTVSEPDSEGTIIIKIENYKSSIRAVKVDSANENRTVEDAHFALYRQVMGKNGLRKDYQPLTGYEDMVSDENGVIPGIDDTLPAGTYYLCETEAPSGYYKLDHDILLSFNGTGNITVLSEADKDMVKTETRNDVQVCTLQIPNRKTMKSIPLNPQTFVADFGLNIAYKVTENNHLVPDNSDYTYIGVCDMANYDEIGSENEPALIAGIGTVCKGKYGSLTLDAEGNTTYTIDTMRFTGEDEFCLVAKVTKIGGTTLESPVYAYEVSTYFPATTVYYEDNFVSDDNYHDGTEKTATGYNFGKWSKKTSGEEGTFQAADFALSKKSNIFGYDPNYTDCDVYSNNSAHYVQVSDANKSWPYMEFDFAGTGFDLVSVTSGDTGIFTVRVYKLETDENGNVTQGAAVGSNQMVDTYYGYDYGRLYMDASGAPTLTKTETMLYKATQTIIENSPTSSLLDTNGMILTRTPTYFDSDGNPADEEHYYDPSGNVTDKVYYVNKNDSSDVRAAIPDGQSDSYEPNYAYAFAEGWVVNPTAADALYQIPVIKVRNLDYGAYRARIEPRFTTRYNHYKTVDSYKYFDLYVDAFRIYDPAGVGDDGTLTSTTIQEAYDYSNEAYEKFTTLKKMVVGAETLGTITEEGKASQEGLVLVDGNKELTTSRLNDYNAFGPNNELYLRKNMSVAFEICANEKPADVQIQMKKISAANPTLKVTYITPSGIVYRKETEIRTATDLSYSVLNMIGKSNITWSKIPGLKDDVESAYSSGLVIISNVGEDQSLLSITNLKWTFVEKGKSLKILDGDYTVKISKDNVSSAQHAIAFTKRNTVVTQNAAEPAVYSDGQITMTVTTGVGVDTLIVKDKDGNPIDESLLNMTFTDIDNDQRLWTITMEESEDGDYTFFVAGTSNELVSGDSIRIDVTVENELQENETEPVQEPEAPASEGTKSSLFAKFLDRIRSFWMSFIEMIKKLLSMFGVTIG